MNTRRAVAWAAWVCLAGAAVAVCSAAGCGDVMGMGMGMGIDLTGGRPTGGTPSLPESQEAYTILLCPPYFGADHARDSAEAKRKTESVTGWKGIYVVHEDYTSSMFLGRYATEEEAGRDVQKVRQWKTPQGTLPFQYAGVTKRLGQNLGPPEWDLAQARLDPNGYTVVIAEFYNVGKFAERIETTVANCRDLRGKKVEAYYYHGPARSYLTVGVFPAEAYRMEATPDGGMRAVLDDERVMEILKERPFLAVNGYASEVGDPDPRTKTSRFRLPYVTAISEFRGSRPWSPAIPRRQPQPR